MFLLDVLNWVEIFPLLSEMPKNWLGPVMAEPLIGRQQIQINVKVFSPICKSLFFIL